MTFNEWWEKKGGEVFMEDWQLAKEAWNAGQQEQKEKDAKIVLKWKNNTMDNGYNITAVTIAKAIRNDM